jgi:hypothetical protein
VARWIAQCINVRIFTVGLTTVDPRDNLVLYGAHALQKAIQLSVRLISGIHGYRTAKNTPPDTM